MPFHPFRARKLLWLTSVSYLPFDTLALGLTDKGAPL